MRGAALDPLTEEPTCTLVLARLALELGRGGPERRVLRAASQAAAVEVACDLGIAHARLHHPPCLPGVRVRRIGLHRLQKEPARRLELAELRVDNGRSQQQLR